MKFLFKLAVIIVAVWILLQIPVVSNYVNQLSADVGQKVQNVQNEADRVKGKYDNAVKKVEETKDNVNSFIKWTKETMLQLETAVRTIKKTSDAISGIFVTSKEPTTGTSVDQPSDTPSTTTTPGTTTTTTTTTPSTSVSQTSDTATQSPKTDPAN